MSSLQHQHGADTEMMSTPNWSICEPHQFGASQGVSLTNNIEALRMARGWSRPELGSRMGTSGQQIERLEKGQRKLTQDWMERAATAFGVRATEIISSDGAAAVPAKTSDQPVMRAVDAGETATLGRLDLSLPMGPGASVDDYVEDEPVIFDLGYLRVFTRTPAHRLKLARGVGDSMSPTILPNDEVLIDTTQNQLLHSDRVYAASINGGAAIKRLRPIEGGKRILVISDNKTIEAYAVDADEVRIWGRVIRFARDL
ncbi:LexA family transcriptional regulator [Sphingomonas sp. AX6]|uniref:LexA family transcriptional regulator n=1 Tax=Sphingomonas sp. AX6 TaxID=2653171 RepID=UPI001F2F86F0|nr:LexA family transcriptional regulator [Sphingomonas sp. AX6]